MACPRHPSGRLSLRHLFIACSLLVLCTLANPSSGFDEEEVNAGLELLNESWLLWNETERSTENYCFVTTHPDHVSPCLLTDTMQHQSNSDKSTQDDPSDDGDSPADDSDVVFFVKSAISAIRSCFKESKEKRTCGDCSVVHKKIDASNHVYSGPAQDITANIDVDTSLLTLQQWYQWCAEELTAEGGTTRVFYLDFFNTTGFLQLCGYQNRSCAAATDDDDDDSRDGVDSCFVGVQVTQLVVDSNKTNNCQLPVEQESKSHQVESIALAVSFGTVFILVLVGASIVVFVKQQRKRALRMRDSPPMSAFPAANYHELSLFQDSDSTSSSSSSDSEELGLN